MRCQAITRRGVACARAALRQGRVCASHAGRCGARPGNRNALRHGLYSRALSAAERLSLAEAYHMQGMDAEIGVTRLMLVRALRKPDLPPAAYARLANVLCRQLSLQQRLAREASHGMDGALDTLLDTIAREQGLAARAERRGDDARARVAAAPRRQPRTDHQPGPTVSPIRSAAARALTASQPSAGLKNQSCAIQPFHRFFQRGSPARRCSHPRAHPPSPRPYGRFLPLGPASRHEYNSRITSYVTARPPAGAAKEPA